MAQNKTEQEKMNRIRFPDITPGDYSNRAGIYHLKAAPETPKTTRTLKSSDRAPEESIRKITKSFLGLESFTKRGLGDDSSSLDTGATKGSKFGKSTYPTHPDSVYLSYPQGSDKTPFIGALTEEEKLAEDKLTLAEDKLTKQETITALEQILSENYGAEVTITKIRELPTSRKSVKEVRFLVGNELSKVWIFKANPDKTAQELAAYKIIYEQGIPTGRPIGFQPGFDKKYPFDIAILGGVIEHAGDSYDELVKSMELRPDKAFSIAEAVCGNIAEYHKKLTPLKHTFEAHGLELKINGPRKELKERMLAALEIDEKDAACLIEACESLYNRQSGIYVVSHGDIHTGNIVTISKYNGITHQAASKINEFGIIDWGSICLDNPFADVADFWVHHFRLAHGLFKNHNYSFESIVNSYMKSVKSAEAASGDIAEGASEKAQGIELNRNDAVIQFALWNIYEMFDPVRKDPKDIKYKAEYHHIFAKETLGILAQEYPEAKDILSELKNIADNYIADISKKEYI